MQYDLLFSMAQTNHAKSGRGAMLLTEGDIVYLPHDKLSLLDSEPDLLVEVDTRVENYDAECEFVLISTRAEVVTTMRPDGDGWTCDHPRWKGGT